MNRLAEKVINESEEWPVLYSTPGGIWVVETVNKM
jgi:hypothetical protein